MKQSRTKLVDQHGRHIHKLRLALLDACNFRCIYCMPDDPKFMHKKNLLSSQELISLATHLVDLGIDEIRLTGGEPTLRSDLLEIIRGLDKLNLSKLGLTTNGQHMAKLLPELKNTTCKHLNFSLDSLNKVGFQKMTGSPHLEKVLESIFMAKELGFNVKINAVLMKGFNDKEIEDFIDFSGRYDIEVRFLELMRIGEARESFEKKFVSADEIIERLKKFSSITPISLPIDSTSFNFTLSNGANIGIIASESKPFCTGCSRLRLSADAILRPCLMMNEGYSLRGKDRNEISDLLHKTMSLKPIERIYDVSQPMNQIGG
ncbi:GTP 3',8-cyclase MoaA [Halobacteriovorax sp. HLS]|uniref:GTP 3',8-cyclase MoaA n=1 Tax=Halobacteriovorax sp. HLS TaxID=2234000 RepID=UPI000FD9D583|nr:GTP 3',8-cyclase MoaA [Halobacteriovorax sp. HLS]